MGEAGGEGAGFEVHGNQFALHEGKTEVPND